MAVVVGEFNGDTDPDIAVATLGADRIQVFEGTGATAATFAAPTEEDVDDSPRALAVASVTGDANHVPGASCVIRSPGGAGRRGRARPSG